jgi:hypothetical protein
LEEEPERFEVEIRNKEKGIFLDASPGRIVLGPRTSAKKKGEDDHLTVVLNGDSIDQVHRKADGTEVWHHTGESLQAQLDSMLANATESLDGSEFRAPNTYIVSVRRATILFSVLTLPFSIFMSLFGGLFGSAEISEDENGVAARIVFNQRRIQRFIRSAQLPLSLLSKIVQKIPQMVFLKPMKFMAKRILVNPQDIQNLKDDLLFVISEGRIGLISPSDSGRVKFTSVVPLLAAYERLSASVPVTLDDIGDFEIGSEIRMKGSRNPSMLL